jgi:hypothetical protein
MIKITLFIIIGKKKIIKKTTTKLMIIIKKSNLYLLIKCIKDEALITFHFIFMVIISAIRKTNVSTINLKLIDKSLVISLTIDPISVPIESEINE